MTRIAAALALIATSLIAATGAPAATPGQINYQGLLLNQQGQKVNGSVNLVFAIYDAAQNGTLLWNESHPGVPVLDGVYDVVLGTTTPITSTVVAGGALYLQITVGGETLTPRQRLVAVPYAVRASDADKLGGVDAVYFSQLIHYVDLDGGAPANDDPSEGTADVDGDGRANFVDNDNDNDGILDAAEVAQGSNINVITPKITNLQPQSALHTQTTDVTVTGTNFDAGLSVAFGSQNPTPQNLTATSFKVTVGPQVPGTVAVTATRANGQSAATSFVFAATQPDITSFQPQFLSASTGGTVTVNGTGFAPGLAVTFGSETPTPQNLTSTSFDVTVGPHAAGVVQVTVYYPAPGGGSDSANFSFIDTQTPKRVFVTSTTYDGNLGGIAGANAKCAARAAAASLSGTYLAWIGDSNGADPDDSFTKSFAYAGTTGTAIAACYACLTDGSLDSAINRDEFGNVQSGTVWTNVNVDGKAQANSCLNWSSSSSSDLGRFGSATSTNSQWTVNGALFCNDVRRLYCFEQ